MIFITIKNSEDVTNIVGIAHDKLLAWQKFGANFGVHGAKIMKMKRWNNSCVG
jgi:hypothetical protein